MSYTTAPQAVTGSIITITNPSTATGGNFVAVQIRNASYYVLTVSGGAQQPLIDPFTATTIPIATGTNLSINPSFLTVVAGSGAQGYLSTEWLLDGEQPSEPDGPLTAAATIAAISGFQLINLGFAEFSSVDIGYVTGIPSWVQSITCYPLPPNEPWAAGAVNAPITITGVETEYIYFNSGPAVNSLLSGPVQFNLTGLDTELEFQSGQVGSVTFRVVGSGSIAPLNSDAQPTVVSIGAPTVDNPFQIYAPPAIATGNNQTVLSVPNNDGQCWELNWLHFHAGTGAASGANFCYFETTNGAKQIGFQYASASGCALNEECDLFLFNSTNLTPDGLTFFNTSGQAAACAVSARLVPITINSYF
jgi:hypothetical protein